MSSQAKIALTDPAKELLQLFTSLRDQPESKTTAEHFATSIGCKPDDPLTSFAISVLIQRCERVRLIVAEAHDLDEYRNSISSALTAMQNIFGYQYLARDWQSTKTNFIRPEHLVSLQGASISLRRTHPLKQLTSDMKDDMLAKLDDAIASLNADGLTGTAIEASFQLLRKMVERFNVFGYDAVKDRTIVAYTEIKALERWAPNASRSVKRCVAAIGAIAVALTAVNEGLDTVVGLYQKGQGAIELIAEEGSELLQLPAPLKQLPAPERPSEEADDPVTNVE